MNITQFTDWQMLLTFGGATAVTAVLTQILKGFFDKLPIDLSTRFFSYLIAVVLLLAATFFTGSRELSEYVICAVNAALVSLSANGSFDMVKSMRKDTLSMDIFDEEEGG